MLPAIAERDEFAALVIRTDFSDDRAWQSVLAELSKPWEFDGSDDVDPHLHVVDDPAWSGATPDAVIAALSGDPELSVVYLADGVAMEDHEHTLLVVSVPTREEHASDEEYTSDEEHASDEEFEADGGTVRTVPAGIGDIHANLSIANLAFADIVEAARNDPSGIFRSF
ncbi:DUF6924 domain-containing protein [Kitasatospora sp. NPDC051705]|uniref:DUF6924 domain-containing protein n=1 Tax=Kitasatospora sp. NPDC051705 TaxID=3364057 RepID=UPI0037B9F116